MTERKEKLKVSIFTACVLIHEASIFNVILDKGTFPRGKQPKKRQLIDDNTTYINQVIQLCRDSCLELITDEVEYINLHNVFGLKLELLYSEG